MKKIFIFGVLPPPIGGVSIHIERLLKSPANKDFSFYLFDIKKFTFYKNRVPNRKYKALYYFLKSNLVHIHTSNNTKLLIAIFCKVFFKKVIYTHHNSVVTNHFIFKLMLRTCDHTILVNDKHISFALLSNFHEKISVIPAFIPPSSIPPLPKWLIEKLRHYENIVSTNCFRLNYIDDKEVYGFDLIIEAFKKLSLNEEIKNTIFILLDPSGTYKTTINKQIKDKYINSNELIYIENINISFSALLRHSSASIRATRTDGDSLSVRESLYYGVPVIASNVVNRPEGAVLFENNDKDSLALNIKDVLINNTMHKKITKHDFIDDITSIYTALT